MTEQTIISDSLDPARAMALWATLGAPREITPGAALAPFFHQIYFWDPLPPQGLGRDGHPKLGGGLIPDLGLPRRMWAGGQLRFFAPLRAGIAATRRSHVCNVARKEGRSGPLAFVTVQHDIVQDGVLCVSEWQDLVYREDPDPVPDPDPDAPRPVPPRAAVDETEARSVEFDSTMLFRYSALTFNGHRIHYDETYARSVEGYDGLVVHGPLLAQLLMFMAQDLRGPLSAFRFRATAPLMHTERAELCHRDGRLWVRGPDGRQCMEAQAQ